MTDYLQLIWNSLKMNPIAFETVQHLELHYALTTLFLAGLSTQLGQSVILFANRVKPPRFVLSILVGSAFYFFNFVVWSLSIWLLGKWLARDIDFVVFFNVIGLAQAPYLLGFLIFVPFLGNPLNWVLSTYSLFAALIGIQVIFDVPFMEATIISSTGWMLLQVFQRTVGRPLLELAHTLRSRVAGLEDLHQTIKAKHLLEHIETRLERETQPLL